MVKQAIRQIRRSAITNAIEGAIKRGKRVITLTLLTIENEDLKFENRTLTCKSNLGITNNEQAPVSLGMHRDVFEVG